MRCSISTVSACGLLLVANRVVAEDSYALIPHLDPQCTQPIESGTANGFPATDATFANSAGVHNFPYYTPINQPTFPGAEAKVGSGYDVYWKIGDLGPQCRVLLALQYSQSSYGSMGFAAPPGNTILAVKNAGCYYSSIPSSASLFSSFCCGDDDCRPWVAGDAALLKKREEEPDLTADLQSSSLEEASTNRKSKSLTGKASEYKSLMARDNFDGTACKTNVASHPFPEAGQQVMVADPQTCSSTACSFNVANGVTTSTSFTSGQDTTITNTVGGSVSVKSGINFLIEGEVTVTAEYSWAKAVSQSTSTTLMNSTTTTISHTLGQQVGTTAFVTFTPTYLCWSVTVDCGAGETPGFSYCEPQIQGSLLEGDYTVVYTG